MWIPKQKLLARVTESQVNEILEKGGWKVVLLSTHMDEIRRANGGSGTIVSVVLEEVFVPPGSAK